MMFVWLGVGAHLTINTANDLWPTLWPCDKIAPIKSTYYVNAKLTYLNKGIFLLGSVQQVPSDCYSDIVNFLYGTVPMKYLLV